MLICRVHTVCTDAVSTVVTSDRGHRVVNGESIKVCITLYEELYEFEILFSKDGNCNQIRWHIWHFRHVWIDNGIVSLQGHNSSIIDVYKKISRLNWIYGFQSSGCRRYTCYQFLLLILMRKKLMQLWTKVYPQKLRIIQPCSEKSCHAFFGYVKWTGSFG
jgi:hypothetical protein